MKQKPFNSAHFLRRFWSNEDGSPTVESVIWIPIFVAVLVLMTNLSLVFYEQSSISRVVQDTNRLVALRYLTDEAAAEAYLNTQLSDIAGIMTANTEIAGLYVTTTVTVPALGLMPLNFTGDWFQGANIVVVGSQLLEAEV